MIDPEELLGRLAPLGQADALHGAGVYAFALADEKALPSIEVSQSNLLYVGMTDQCLEARNHFVHAHSGFSTLRRSLGALVKGQLDLKAFCRAGGASKTNWRNYRFSALGEQRLSEWMRNNLLFAQLAIPSGALAEEKELIRLLRPPLNLTGWPNPQAGFIKRLRADCAAEAERNGTIRFIE